MAYWDTAPVLKLYTLEHDSQYFMTLAASAAEDIVTSAVSEVEMLSALYRKEHAGELRARGASALCREFRADCKEGRITLIPYSADVANEAERLVTLAYGRPRPIMIRAIDLIHAASAISARAETIVTTDARLREIARRAGLKLLP